MPEGIIESTFTIWEDILVARIGLVLQGFPCLFVVEVSGVSDAGEDGCLEQYQEKDA